MNAPEPNTFQEHPVPHPSPAEATDEARTPRKIKPVAFYLVTLILAVLALLLLSYFMQERNNQQLESLNQSVSSIQNTYNESINTIDAMQSTITQQISEIDQLEEQVGQLQTQLEAMEQDYLSAQQELEEATAALQEQADSLEELQTELTALNLLWQLEQEYLAKDYEHCGQLLTELAAYTDSLSQEQLDRYQQLYSLLESYITGN